MLIKVPFQGYLETRMDKQINKYGEFKGPFNEIAELMKPT